MIRIPISAASPRNFTPKIQIFSWESSAMFKHLAFATLIILASLTFGVKAGTSTWDGVGGSGSNWNNASNWDSAPTPPTVYNLIFPAGASRLSNNNNLVTNANSITISGTGYTLGGATTISFGAGNTGISATYWLKSYNYDWNLINCIRKGSYLYRRRNFDN
jgi:hypothetical protein